MDKLTLKELRKRCEDAGLKYSGTKDVLIERLEAQEFRCASILENKQLKERIRRLEDALLNVQAETNSNCESLNANARSTPMIITNELTPSPRLTKQSDLETSRVHKVGGTTVCACSPHVSAAASTPLLSIPSLEHTSSLDIRNVVAALPDFDPTNDVSLSSKQFVQRVQALKNAYNWRDEVIILAVQQKLKGHAKLWSDAKREVFTTWNQLAEELVASFPFDDNPASIHIKMANEKRERGETPQAYYYRMLAMGIKFGLQEGAIARHIINGINEPDLGKKISNEYRLCSDLLHDINTYCRYNDVNYPYNKYQYTAPRTRFFQSRNDTEQRIKCYNQGWKPFLKKKWFGFYSGVKICQVVRFTKWFSVFAERRFGSKLVQNRITKNKNFLLFLLALNISFYKLVLT